MLPRRRKISKNSGQASQPAQNATAWWCRRWPRRLLWALGIFVAIVIVLRAALWASLPWILDKTMREYGLRSSYERLTLSLLTGDAELWHLEFRPVDSNDLLAHVEYCRAEVSTTTLLTRRLVVPRVEVDGMDINLVKATDGTFPQLRHALNILEKRKGAEVAAKSETKPAPVSPGEIDLTPPLKLDAMRFQHVQLNYRDESVSPVFETRLDMSVRLSDLGSDKRKTRFQISISSPPALDQLIAEGAGSSAGMDLLADLKLTLNGLHPRALVDYLGPLGLSAEADNVTFACSGQVRTRGITDAANQAAGAKAGKTPPAPRTLGAHFDLKDVVLSADETECFALKRVAIDANLPPSGGVELSNLELENGRASVWKKANKVLTTAGLGFPGRTASEPTTEKRPPANAQKSTSAPQFSVGRLSLRDLQLIFHDESVSPKTDLALQVKNVAVTHDQSGQTPQSGSLNILAELGIPGVIQTIGLKGTSDLESPRKKAALELSAGGIRPDSLVPYLQTMGIESLYQNGEFTCDVNLAVGAENDGSISGDVSLTNILLKDKDDLFGLKAIALEGLRFDPNSKTTRIEALDISGQNLALGRDAAGCFNVLGLRFVGAPKQTKESRKPQPESAPDTQAGKAGSIPRIEIGRFSWHDNKVTFVDQAISPATSILVPDFGFELKDLVLDFNGEPASPGALSGWIRAPGIITRAALNGSVTTKKSGLALDLKFTGEELTAAEVAPYLRNLGMESTLANGGLQANMNADLAWAPESLTCSVAIRDVALADGPIQLAGLKRLQVDKLQVQSSGLAFESIELDQPFLSASREQSGSLNMAGLRLLPPKEPKPRPASDSKPATPTASQPATGMKISRLSLNDARLHWSDEAVKPAVSQTLAANAALSGFTVGLDAPPATFNVTLEAPGLLKKADLSGELYLNPSGQGVNLKLEADGIQTEPLGPYFSSSAKPALNNAHLGAEIKANLSKHQAGGYKASLSVGNVDYRNGDAQASLLKLDSAKAVLGRIDPNAGVVAIEELSLHGLEASGERRAPDVLSVLGFELRSEGSPSVSVPEPNDKAAAGTLKENQTKADANTPGQAPSKDQKVRPKKLPLVTLDTLDVQVKEFAFKDQTKTGAAPIVLSSLMVRNREPIKLLGEDPDANPPVNIDVTAKLAPFTESVALKTELSPFTMQPRMAAEWNIGQIHTSSLPSVMPELAQTIDANSPSNGQFSGKAELTLKLDRRDVLDFNLNKPFGLDVLLKNVQLVDTDKKITLAGLEELRVDAPKVDLTQKSIHLKEIGLVKPQGTISKERDGMHVLGITLKAFAQKPSADANNTEPQKSVDAKAAEPRNEPQAGTQAKSGAQGPDVRVDQLLVNGIDFTFVDRTSEPAIYVPLTGLDVEVRGFATQTAEPASPIRFNAILTAGEVPLPKKNKEQAAATDANATQTEPKTGDSAAMEKRILFQEMSVTGRLALYPKPDGWMKAGLSGLEMVNFKGAAGKSGVTLNDGILDASVDMRFQKQGTVSTRTRLMFTDLSLTEPPDGFFKQLLSLPTSLDTVLFILQDSDGAIRIPLAFKIEDGRLSRGQLVGAAVGAAASVIANAVASSPFRIAGTAGDILGVDQKEAKAELETVVLQYAPGVTASSGEQAQQLNKILERLKKDKNITATIRHELGGGDIKRAGSLVNPSLRDTTELLAQLKLDKTTLEAGRDRLMSETKAAYAAGAYTEGWQKTRQLQEIETKLGLAERSLDDLLEMMRPGTEHAAGRRTRDACLAIGRARLEAIAGVLAQKKNIPRMQERIRFIPPRFTEALGGRGGSVTITLTESKAP